MIKRAEITENSSYDSNECSMVAQRGDLDFILNQDPLNDTGTNA